MRRAILLLGLLFGCVDDDADGITDDSGDTDGERPLQYEPVVELDAAEVGGHPVRFYVPEDPKGLVWAFHGSNGGMNYLKELETIALMNELVGAGFAYVGTHSTKRSGDAHWDETEDVAVNLDMQRLFEIREHLVANTDLEAGTPEFAFGFSNGGAMSGSFAAVCLAHGVDFRAIAPHLSNGNPHGLDIPILWSVGVNDPMPYGEAEHQDRLERGLVSEFLVIPEQPIGPDWFTRNPNIGANQSRKTYEEMVRLGGIDEAGTRLVPVEEVEAWFRTFEKESKISSPTLRTEEIRVAWALHRMNGWYAREVTAFFLDTL